MSPKMNSIGFGAQGHFQKSRNHRKDRFEDSHINKSKTCKSKVTQNSTMELRNISLP